MNETQYILTANRAKLSTVCTILGDVLPGDEYGISESELIELKKSARDSAVGGLPNL